MIDQLIPQQPHYAEALKALLALVEEQGREIEELKGKLDRQSAFIVTTEIENARKNAYHAGLDEGKTQLTASQSECARLRQELEERSALAGDRRVIVEGLLEKLAKAEANRDALASRVKELESKHSLHS